MTTQVMIAYISSNMVGLLLLWTAFKKPKLARLLFVILFGWASWVNYTTSHENPEVYLEYAEKSIGIYSDFINGWFRNHITGFVSFIAIGQALIALGMLLWNSWVNAACIGSILFLLSIAPLGIYAAFPFSLTVSLAAYLILKRDNKRLLWNFQH